MVAALVALTILFPKLVGIMLVFVSVAYLGDFTERTTFFSKIDDHAAAAVLSLLDGLFDAEND